MGKELIINKKLKSWIFDIIEDMLNSTMNDNPEKLPTIIAVNDFINKINLTDNEKIEMSELFGEHIINDIYEEIKSNM